MLSTHNKAEIPMNKHQIWDKNNIISNDDGKVHITRAIDHRFVFERVSSAITMAIGNLMMLLKSCFSVLWPFHDIQQLRCACGGGEAESFITPKWFTENRKWYQNILNQPLKCPQCKFKLKGIYPKPYGMKKFKNMLYYWLQLDPTKAYYYVYTKDVNKMGKFTSIKPDDGNILYWISTPDNFIEVLIQCLIIIMTSLVWKCMVWLPLQSTLCGFICIIFCGFCFVGLAKYKWFHKSSRTRTQKMRCSNKDCGYTTDKKMPSSVIKLIQWYSNIILEPMNRIKCPKCHQKTYYLSVHGNNVDKKIQELNKGLKQVIFLYSCCRKPINVDTIYYCSYNGEVQPLNIEPNIYKHALKSLRTAPNIDKTDETVNFHYNCNGVESCDHLKKVVDTMNQYIDNQNGKMNDFDVDQALNNYLHLISRHDSDQDFEYIVNKIGICDINDCAIFTRNNRRRLMEVTETEHIYDEADIAYHDIMDKIHCYYHHCYDIGNRLLIKDKIEIMNCEETDNDDSDISDSYTNAQKRKIIEILSARRSLHNRVNSELSKAMNIKYTQLDLSNTNNTPKHYSFGYLFEYGYANEFVYGLDDDRKRALVINQSITIHPAKHSSLKEELINNSTAKLTMPQFVSEHTKALIHFNSHHRKSNGKWKHMEVQCILSLMIYCNYNDLQYTLSKTYREQKGAKHDNFYHLGKYLKMSVHIFGETILDLEIAQLYHGIQEQLVFPRYHFSVTNDTEYSEGLNIYSPLSTSSSFEVAVNFSNNNKGLVVEFGPPSRGSCPNCFSVSWLSDFGNEKEYLFVQNHISLKINNIIDTHFAHEYKMLLQALINIDSLMRQHHHQNVVHKNVSFTLMKQIIVHQASRKMIEYQPKIKISKYGKEICDTFFQIPKHIKTCYEEICKHYCADDANLFFENNRWIKLEFINNIFQNIESISVSGCVLSSTILSNITNYVEKKQTHSKLTFIEFTQLKNIVLEELKGIVQQFSSKLQSLHWFIAVDLLHKRVILCSDDTEFVSNVIKNIYDMFFVDDNGKTYQLMRKQRILRNEGFNTLCNHCVKYHHLTMDWETFSKNHDGFVGDLLYDNEHKCINLYSLVELFPNLEQLVIIATPLYVCMLDAILSIFRNEKLKLDIIRFDIRAQQNDLNIADIMNKYPSKFQDIHFCMFIGRDRSVCFQREL